MRTKTVSALAAAALLCLSGLPAAAATKINVVMPVLGLESLPVMVAKDHGYFQAHGLDVTLTAASGGGNAMKSFITGDADVLATGFPEIGELKARGVDAVLLVSQTTRVPLFVVARKDLGITGFAQLKGKNIGVSSPGSLTDYMAVYLAQQQGWNPQRDIGLVSIGGGGAILGALKGKTIDAAVLFEPFVTIGEHEGMLNMIVDIPKEIDAFPAVPFVVHGALLKKSPEVAKALHDAMVEAEGLIQHDKAGAYKIAQARFSTSQPAVLTAAFDHIYPLYAPDGKFSPENLARTQQICEKLGIITTVYSYDQLVAPIDR